MIKERVCYAVVFAVEAATAWFYYSSIYAVKRNRVNPKFCVNAELWCK